MLVLASGWGDVRMPPLGHAPARKLNGPLIERRLELQEEHRLLYVEDPSHDPSKLAARPRDRRRGHAACVRSWIYVQQISFN